MRIVGITCVGNEEGRYLERVLEEKSKLCDVIIVLGDAPTDKTPQICQSFPKVKYFHNPVKMFNTEQWKMKELALKLAIKEYPGWILAFDADELFERRVNRQALEWLIGKNKPAYLFRFVHLWNDENHIRTDNYWDRLEKVIFYKYRPDLPQDFPPKKLHCGLVPMYANQYPSRSGYLVKHFGYMKPKDRPAKIKRYSAFDPQGKIKPKSWYESISQEGKVVPFNEEEFIKTLTTSFLPDKEIRMPRPKIMAEDKNPSVVCINPKGRTVDVPYQWYIDHGKKAGYKLISPEPTLEKPGFEFGHPGAEAKKDEVPSSAPDFTPEAPKTEEPKSESYVCEACGKVCKNAFGLKAHQRSHQSKTDKPKKKAKAK